VERTGGELVLDSLKAAGVDTASSAVLHITTHAGSQAYPVAN
jgi:hypothetical protein